MASLSVAFVSGKQAGYCSSRMRSSACVRAKSLMGCSRFEMREQDGPGRGSEWRRGKSLTGAAAQLCSGCFGPVEPWS